MIRSFNDDKPFDRFVVEQIAGDELDASDPENLIAAGYLRSGPWEHTAMSVAAVTRQQFLDDATHSVGVTFLGQGMRCAQCHDHKFDPIPTRDYYRMQAVFAPVQFADRKVDYLDEENTSSFADTREFTERRLKQSQEFLAKIRKKHNEAVQAYLKERGVERRDQLPEGERPRTGFFGLTKQEMSLEKIHRKRLSYYQRELKRYEPYAFSVYDGPDRKLNSNTAVNLLPPAQKRRGTIQNVSILPGGALEAAGDTVTPGVLSAVYRSNDVDGPTAWNTIPETAHDRRLALARWIASDQNTLTARVIVNRVWQWHFGRGIVATPNSFGVMGSRPTHPELLDWLAVWLMEHDWSIKQLHRLIMTSATYQRSGEHADHDAVVQVDPNNELLAFYPSRRLAAEEIRDSLLAITGELNAEMGGPGCYPEINWEAALQPRHIMGSVAPAYLPSPEPHQRNRRTIYAFRYRMNTGNRFGGDPAVGAWTTFGLGTENQNLPAFVVLPERAFPQGGSGNWSNGFLPAYYQGTTLRSVGSPILDLDPPPGVTRDVQRANLDLLAQLNQRDADRHAHDDSIRARMASYELAFRMQTEVPEILNIDGEKEKVRSLYGIGEPETDNFGRRCLLARRLVESGVRFVQIYATGWDSHDYLERSHAARIRTVDKPIAGLLKDLKRRGLLDETLIIWAGEFGRSADNGIRGGVQAAGRDHNAKAMNVWFAGGGAKAGHAVGATDELGQEAVEVVRPIKDLHVTILRLLGLDDNRLTFFHEGRYKQLSQTGGQEIRELLA